MSKPTYTLTTKDIKEANFRMMMTSIGCFNYATQNGPCVVFGLSKALRKLYPNDEDYKTALLNHTKYFNSQPYMASLIIGAALGMEEQLGIEGADAIQNFKTGIMGPTAGIGDSIFWIIMPSIFTPISVSFANEGSYLGVLIALCYSISLHVFRCRFFGWGKELGVGIVTKFKDYIAPITDSASILGLTVIGCLIPSQVKVTCPAIITLSSGSVINFQALFDMLVPNLLAIVTTFICYKAIGTRKVQLSTLVLIVLVVSVIGSVLHVIG